MEMGAIEFEDEAAEILLDNVSSLAFLQAIYRSPNQTMHMRMRAAALCLPYEHPKLAVTALLDASEDLGARLSRAIQRSAKVEAYRLIEARPTAASNGPAAVYDTAAEVSAAAQRRPMAVIRRR
jgi:hypothetical protein